MIKPSSFADHQIILSASRSLVLIIALGAIAASLFIVNSQKTPTQVLGSNTASPSATPAY